MPVRLVDTAGIREGQDLVESLGIERSYQAIADADLTLIVLDSSSDLQEEDLAIMQKLADRRPILVANKADLPAAQAPRPEAIFVSAATGQGVSELKQAILNRLAPNGLISPEDGSITNIRQATLLREGLEALENAKRAVEFGIPHEMILIDLYAALRPIDGVTGATTADDILNRIFTTFLHRQIKGFSVRNKLCFFLLTSAASPLSSEWSPQYIVAVAQCPVLARSARIQGDVVVECALNAEGTVTDARAISGQPLLVRSALQNVKLWKCKKSDEESLARSGSVTITYHFSLLRKNTRNQPAVCFTFDYPNQVQIVSEGACSDHLFC